jgi:hypothetical protein
MKKLGMAIAVAAGALMIAAPAFSLKDDQLGQGRAVVTILPAHSGEQMANVSQQDLKLKINGKESSVTNWTPLRGPDSRLELMFLIDGSARASLGQQFGEITSFVKEMPANGKVGIAYMENGRAAMAAPLSSDAAQVLKGLRLSVGSPGSNASPYFCLSDLAQHWPSDDRTARREVVMITDGVDNYNRRFDPEDPYVEAAINDSVRAGLVVYSIYWQDQGRANSTEYETNAGQSLLQEVADATGGHSYWLGTGNPVSFEPYFADLRRRLNHQYALGFSSQLNGKPEVKTLKLDLHVASAKVEAPQKVFVTRSAGAPGE